MAEEKIKTSMGLDPNVAGLLCYALGWITGLLFYFLEKDNKFVRFHAIQSIVTFGVFTIVVVIIYYIPIVGWILASILWIGLMIKAYQGHKFGLPWAGSFAEKQSESKPNPVQELNTKPRIVE
jgi:uncharacterized membrane protein